MKWKTPCMNRSFYGTYFPFPEESSQPYDRKRTQPRVISDKVLISKGFDKRSCFRFWVWSGIRCKVPSTKGYNVTGYDPHYAPDQPKGKFDTIVCLYVLNVLLPKEQEYVLMSISELLLPEGSAYFAVRRDIQRDGFRFT